MKITREEQLAALLESSRKESDRTQKSVGDSIDVSLKTMTKLETKPGSSKFETIQKLANEIGLEIHFVKKGEQPSDMSKVGADKHHRGMHPFRDSGVKKHGMLNLGSIKIRQPKDIVIKIPPKKKGIKDA